MTNTEHTNGNLTVHFKVKDFNAWRTSYDAINRYISNFTFFLTRGFRCDSNAA